MGLKLRLRSGERLAINGAVIRNPGERSLEIEVMNSSSLLHQKDVMLPEQADSFIKRVYLYVQLLHLEPEHNAAHASSYGKMMALARSEAEAKSDSGMLALYVAVDALVAKGDYFPALRQMQAVIGKPGETR